MRTHRGFARLFVLLGATFVGAGLTLAMVRTVRAPEGQPATQRRIILPPALSPGSVSVSGPHGVSNDGPVLTWNECRVEGDLRVYNGRRFILTACDLNGANLLGARLAGSRFRKCDLRGAMLVGADLGGLRYDRHTCWPKGFDPQQAGARLVV